MRKLGIKNRKLFILLVVLVLGAISLFSYFIYYASKIEDEEYLLAKDSILYDVNNNFLAMEDETILKKAFDGNFYIHNYSLNESYNIGKNAVVYNANDYQMYIYGVAYQVYEDGSVRKTEKEEVIVKSSGPYFYKLADRKYLMVDSNIFSSDKSLSTSDYLIVEIDKQGNATLTNHEINVKTINPLILKGNKYDFDIVHEKLIIKDQEKEIDLKNVIGSSNEYKDPVAEEEKEEDKTVIDEYYNDYLDKVVDSFNNLYNSVGNINDQNNNKNDSNSNLYLDLTRWVSLSKITTDVTSITINYNVFDPNNEYSQIFLKFKSTNSEDEATTIYLSKEQSTYTIHGLKYNHEYSIEFGYVLATVLDELQTPVINDAVKAKTKNPEMNLNITKITSDKIYYQINFDKNYQIDTAKIKLYSDNTTIKEIAFTKDMIDTDYKYIGSFDYENLGFLVEIKMENIVYSGDQIDLTYSAKYVNRTE